MRRLVNVATPFTAFTCPPVSVPPPGLAPIVSVMTPVKLVTTAPASLRASTKTGGDMRSEEHTSELQSQSNLVCRLLLEKKKKKRHQKYGKIVIVEIEITLILILMDCHDMSMHQTMRRSAHCVTARLSNYEETRLLYDVS